MKRRHVSAAAIGRLAALSGVFFVAISMAAPDPNIGIESPSVEEVKDFYLDNAQSFSVAFLLGGLAYAFFLVFLMILRSQLRRAEGGDGTLAALALGAGVLVAGFQVLGTSLWAAPGLELTSRSDPAEVEAAAVLGASSNALVEIATFWRGLLLAAVALVVLRYAAMPRWLGWMAAALAFGALIGAVSFVESALAPVMVVLGFGSYVLFHVWVFLASIVLAVRSGGTFIRHATDREPVPMRLGANG
jgi:hypothetical protein